MSDIELQTGWRADIDPELSIGGNLREVVKHIYAAEPYFRQNRNLKWIAPGNIGLELEVQLVPETQYRDSPDLKSATIFLEEDELRVPFLYPVSFCDDPYADYYLREVVSKFNRHEHIGGCIKPEPAVGKRLFSLVSATSGEVIHD